MRCSWSLVILVLSAALVASCSTPPSRTPLQSVGTFEVPGNAPFFNTGFDLVPGRYYMFMHRGGTVCVQQNKACSPPRGKDIPGEEAWGLKLKIGDEYVQIRDRLILTVDNPTPLEFYIPEGDELEYSESKLPYYEDNTGSWTIEVITFQEPPEVTFWKGANVTSYTSETYCGDEMGTMLRRLVSLGANAVQFVVVYETDLESIYPVSYSPRAFCIVQATQVAKDLGLAVGWNLHVDPPENGWRGAIEPPDRKAFFESYREFAVYYAGLAQLHNVDYLIPATEMVSTMATKEDQNRWLSIFSDIHGVFFGEVFYAADRVDFAQLSGDFWHSCCDLVGMTPWYTLSDKPLPDAKEMEEAWKPIARNLERFSQAVKMRMVLVEGPGYRRLESCATEPADYLTKKKPSDLCQLEAYKAFLRTFTAAQKQTLAGYFIWEINLDKEDHSDYSPLDSITESVLKQAWNGQRP
jgi:hypothetical protein